MNNILDRITKKNGNIKKLTFPRKAQNIDICYLKLDVVKII